MSFRKGSGRYLNDEKRFKKRSLSNSKERSEGGERVRHPPHLKGREIGLWYSKRQKEQGEKQDAKPVGTIKITESKQEQIKSLLNTSTPPYVLKDTKSFDHIESSSFKNSFLKIRNGNITEKLVNVTNNLIRNESLDESLKEEFLEKQKDAKYKKMQMERQRLPSHQMRDAIIQLIELNQVVIIGGETGCGKTTQVAQFILDEYLMNGKGSVCNVICTQPRRISAISVAERVAQERAERLGKSVGFQIRLESKRPRDYGSILFCTTGVILKIMEDNPSLSGISHLILDEIHERNVLEDYLIALLKKIIEVRKDLKLIMMSATLNAEKFAQYFGADVIEIPGFTYDVKEYYLEDVLKRTGFVFPTESKVYWKKKMKQDFDDYIIPHVRKLEAEKSYPRSVTKELMKPISEEINMDLVMALLLDICAKEKDQGAILVFLTGFSDINTLNSKMEQSKKFPSSRYRIFPLHSQLATVEQKFIFSPPPRGVRKIILSTNIAETSITIDDVVFVIDCGKIKMTNFNIEHNQQTLLPEWVSLANANQRRGRAGRVKPGVCFHLFTKARNMILEKYQKPEILRKRLEDDILMIKILQVGKADEFLSTLMDIPDKETVQISIDLLKRLNALDEDEMLTPLGYHLAKLPMGPQTGKMILLGSIFSCLDPILSIASALDYKDPFRMPLGSESVVNKIRFNLSDDTKSDHIAIINAVKKFENVSDRKQYCTKNYLSHHTMTLLQKMKFQFGQYLHEMNFLSDSNPSNPDYNINSENTSLIKAIICAGLYPNVIINRFRFTKRIGRNSFYTLDKRKVTLHPKSVLNCVQRFDSPLLVYFLKIKSGSDNVHDGTMVHPLPLIFFGDNFTTNGNNGVHCVSINRTLKFICSENTGALIKDLRDRLNLFLEHKVAHPKAVNWKDEEEVSTLKAIIELITIEDSGIIDTDASDDFD